METTLGERIVSHRKKLGLTQDKLAELLGVTAQAVSKWENDQSCPDITMLPKLAEIFHTTTDELLGVTAVAQAAQDEPAEDAANSENCTYWGPKKLDAMAMAVFVILVGALTLLSRVFSWNTSFWSILWPSAILIIGIRSICEKFSFFSAGCTLIGCYFLLINFMPSQFKLSGDLAFPIIVLVFGAALLFDALKKPKHEKRSFHNGSRAENQFSVDGESFICSLSFGENTRLVTMPKLSYGEVSCSFGSFLIDLSGCADFSGGCRIDARCSFGELKLRVPRHIQVETNASTAFGSMDISGQADAAPKGTLYLDSKVSFGEITVEYV